MAGVALSSRRDNSDHIEVNVERPTLRDISGLHSILLSNKHDISLFQRPRNDIQRNLPDFLLAIDEKARMLGCVAVHFHQPGAAEMLSLSITPRAQGKGIGGRLVAAAEKSALDRGARSLWLITNKPAYFAKFGYRPVSRFRMPRAVLWAKFKQVLLQPPSRWVPTLFWRFSFMEKAKFGA